MEKNTHTKTYEGKKEKKQTTKPHTTAEKTTVQRKKRSFIKKAEISVTEQLKD